VRRSAMTAVRPVRPDRDGVEMIGQTKPFVPSLSRDCLS
jgi:hypothetical protein